MPSSTQREMYLETGSAFPDLLLQAGIMIHRNTSVYINIHQVEPRLAPSKNRPVGGGQSRCCRRIAQAGGRRDAPVEIRRPRSFS
jgi:hypothetical protein